MARPLVTVAMAGIVTSVITLTVAALLDRGNQTWSPYYYGPYRGNEWARPDTTPFSESGETVTRDLVWNGADTVQITIPGTVYYEPALQPRITVRGPKSSVDHLRVDGGRIYFDGSLSGRQSSIEVHIRGQAITSFDLLGRGQLVLTDVRQEAVSVALRGSGSVRGNGRVERLKLRIFGSGDADLASLATIDVDVDTFGSGDTDIAPSGDADIFILGSGDVRLHARPANLSTRSIGSGKVLGAGANPRPNRNPISRPPAPPDEARIDI